MRRPAFAAAATKLQRTDDMATYNLTYASFDRYGSTADARVASPARRLDRGNRDLHAGPGADGTASHDTNVTHGSSHGSSHDSNHHAHDAHPHDRRGAGTGHDRAGSGRTAAGGSDLRVPARAPGTGWAFAE